MTSFALMDHGGGRVALPLRGARLDHRADQQAAGLTDAGVLGPSASASDHREWLQRRPFLPLVPHLQASPSRPTTAAAARSS